MTQFSRIGIGLVIDFTQELMRKPWVRLRAIDKRRPFGMLPRMTSDLTIIFDTIERLDRAATHTQPDRKQAGITYTPRLIARSMVALVDPGPNETIHEPSCGRGVFAFAMVEHWLNKGWSLQKISHWAKDHLWLSDIDEAAINDLHSLWNSFFQQEGVDCLLLNAKIVDGLFGEHKDRHFDVIVGNPPYVRIQNVDTKLREKLRTTYSSCGSGNVDLYYAFFEDALRRAKRVCYIMPNSWFSNQSAKQLRQIAKPRISKLIDFGSRLVFAPVRAYTAIVMATTTPDGPIEVAQGLPEEGYPRSCVERNDPRWSDAAWTPLLDYVRHDGNTLGNITEIVSGIATLADKAYLLPNPTVITVDGQRLVQQVDPDFPEHTLCIPEIFAPRLIKATRPVSIDQQGPRILCPYDSQWKLVVEQDLHRQAPELLAWLSRRRQLLDGRDKGKTHNYEGWYAYGRRQGFWTCKPGEVVLMVPQMGNGSLAPYVIDTAKTGGRFLFTSGYALRPNIQHSPQDIAHYIAGSKAWQFVQKEGKAWAGRGDYRTVGARALRRMPYPD